MGRILAVANQKGGVGKTTTAINLGASLALADQRVLLVDADPQCNLSSGVGLKGQSAPAGDIYDALMTEDLGDASAFVVPTKVSGLFAIPADRNLAGAEIELVPMLARETRLRRVIEPLRSRFDYILIDCPPSLGLLTLNALVACDAVLIPLHCEYFALEGLADLVGTLKRVRTVLNPALDIDGVLLTMYDERTNLGQQVSRDVRAFFKDKVFHTVIPRNVRLGEAPSHGMPVILYDVKSRGAEAYLALAREMLARNGRAPHDLVCHELKATMVEKRHALGRGLDALISDALEGRAAPPARRSRWISTASRRTATSRACEPTTRASTNSRSRSRPTASSSRSWCTQRATATRSSPASAAGAPPSAPGSSKCRSPCARCPKART